MNAERDWRTQCETGSLTYSDAIQLHGGLIHLDAQQRASYASAQIGHHLPLEILGKPLAKTPDIFTFYQRSRWPA
ncbi:MAG: hypothetical protein Q8N96_13145 [Methylovulum sp.]|nr:hypothetical protein [Methylovulum sp.]